ncbi:MAG: hypothetical protein LBB21_02805 [Holosporaceae bacterium]|nr:hypothetical protein [Holosporaceae bacterium]
MMKILGTVLLGSVMATSSAGNAHARVFAKAEAKAQIATETSSAATEKIATEAKVQEAPETPSAATEKIATEAKAQVATATSEDYPYSPARKKILQAKEARKAMVAERERIARDEVPDILPGKIKAFDKGTLREAIVNFRNNRDTFTERVDRTVTRCKTIQAKHPKDNIGAYLEQASNALNALKEMSYLDGTPETFQIFIAINSLIDHIHFFLMHNDLGSIAY